MGLVESGPWGTTKTPATGPGGTAPGLHEHSTYTYAETEGRPGRLASFSLQKHRGMKKWPYDVQRDVGNSPGQLAGSCSFQAGSTLLLQASKDRKPNDEKTPWGWAPRRLLTVTVQVVLALLVRHAHIVTGQHGSWSVRRAWAESREEGKQRQNRLSEGAGAA